MTPENNAGFLSGQGLPTLYDGVAQEVIDEMMDNSNFDNFTDSIYSKVKKENPNVIYIIDSVATVVPRPEQSVALLLSYYEMYSRSAQREGNPMMYITNEVIDYITAIEQDKEYGVLESEQALLEANQKGKKERKNAIHKDSELSSELEYFWGFVEWGENCLREIKEPEVSIDGWTYGVFLLRKIFLEQDRRNKALLQ
jgi:hypothetical protein